MAIHKVLIDTNVCLDAALRRPSYAANAIEILVRSEAKEYIGLLSAHSFDTIFYFLQKSDSIQRAYKGIKGLRKAVDIAPVTQQVVDNALEAQWDDAE